MLQLADRYEQNFYENSYTKYIIGLLFTCSDRSGSEQGREQSARETGSNIPNRGGLGKESSDARYPCKGL